MFLIGFLINLALLLWCSRRLLGVSIGWGRAVLLLAGFTLIPYLVPQATTDALLRLEPWQVALSLALVGAWAITAQLVILTMLEALIPTRSVPPLSIFLRDIPSRWRRFRRLVAIWWIFTRNGLGALFGTSRDPGQVADHSRVGRSLRRALTQAGVTFIKFGQMLSTRADLLPPTLLRELSTLQNQVPPQPWEELSQVLTASLPGDPAAHFAQVDPQPLAAASVAQVHSGILRDGRPVVIKIQRPDAQAQVRADLDILRVLAARLERQSDWARGMGVVALADGFAASLREELDYRSEAANTAAVGHAGSGVRVPEIHTALSSDRVLVMERIEGTPLSQAANRLAALGPDRRSELALSLLGSVMHQILVSGVFHADLHPGNIFLTEDGLALLDFGSVGRLDRASRQSLGLLLQAVEREDAVGATDALTALLDQPGNLDDKALQRELGQLILRFDGMGTAVLFTDLLTLVVRHGFQVPPQLAAAFRALGALEGSLRLVDPGMDLVALGRTAAAPIAAAQLSPASVRATLEEQVVTVLPMVQRLPRQLSTLAEQAQEGTLTLAVRGISDLARDSFVQPLVHQLSLSILAASLGLAGVAMVAIPGPVLLAGLTIWAYAGLWFLMFAFVLGTRILTGIFYADSTRS